MHSRARSQWNGSYGADSGPSRRNPLGSLSAHSCRPANPAIPSRHLLRLLPEDRLGEKRPLCRFPVVRKKQGAAFPHSTKAGPLLDVSESPRAWSKRDVAAQFRLEPVEPQDPVVSHVRIWRHPRIVLFYVRTIFCEIPAEGQPSLVVAFVRRIRHRGPVSSKSEGRAVGQSPPRFCA
jgi:hypothetical protein